MYTRRFCAVRRRVQGPWCRTPMVEDSRARFTMSSVHPRACACPGIRVWLCAFRGVCERLHCKGSNVGCGDQRTRAPRYPGSGGCVCSEVPDAMLDTSQHTYANNPCTRTRAPSRVWGAYVCSEVPDAMLVSAQAASNCSVGRCHFCRNSTNRGTTPALITCHDQGLGGARFWMFEEGGERFWIFEVRGSRVAVGLGFRVASRGV